MAKIGIIEDNIEDAVFRYQDLTRYNHEVHIVYDTLRVQPDPDLDKFMEHRGFNLNRVYYGLENLVKIPELQQLDYYFCDGLHGGCFQVIELLGRERLWLVTSDMGIEKQARDLGIQTLDRSSRKKMIATLASK